jgi:hypothetical protein
MFRDYFIKMKNVDSNSFQRFFMSLTSCRPVVYANRKEPHKPGLSYVIVNSQQGEVTFLLVPVMISLVRAAYRNTQVGSLLVGEFFQLCANL